MKRTYLGFVALLAMFFVGLSAKAVGWPANYQGVMLQGFYWDSYKSADNTKWTTLTSKADELSKYFKLIWVPNSAKANGEGGGGNGYMPIYWFSNHNCAFGTETELKAMIKAFKDRGVGLIEDVVVNHRVGVSNWYNFPTETWKGVTYQLTNGAICSTDEMWRTGGQGCPYTRGASDTGEDFDGARDLDHTNANVQNNVKNYCKFLIDEMGYVGFRLDMVKGYKGEYTKIYNQYSKPTFSVGEYWDGNYDAVAAWINATGRESAAFDFPCKYAINEAFHSNDMTKLVWKATGTTDQPAGLIHYEYPQFAVTFVDNHDTYRDGSKFNGNVVAANAFILFSPGTPCVFWPHYQQYKAAIQKLISLRNEVGINNMSAVKVLQTSRDCYMAEIQGTNGKAVVKIGSAQVSPSGYTNAQIKASGTDYCVWTTTEGGGGGGDVVDPTPSVPSKLYILGNIDGMNWTTDKGVTMTKQGNKFTASNVKLVADPKETHAFFTFVTALGASWDKDVNISDRYGATSKNLIVSVGSTDNKIQKFAANIDASSANSWGVTPGTYTITADFDKMTMSITGTGQGNTGGDDKTGEYYVYFNNTKNWANVYVWAWNDANENCSEASDFPGDKMTNKNGKLYWEAAKSKVPTMIIFSDGNGTKAGGGDLKYVNKATYNPDGTYTTESGDSGSGELTGDPIKIYFDNTDSKWATPYVHYWGAKESKYPGVAMSKVTGNIWTYSLPYGSTGILFNAGDGDNTKTDNFTVIANHVYNTKGDQGVYQGGGDEQTGDPFTVYYDNKNTNWSNPYIHYWGNTESTYPGEKMTVHTGTIWKYTVPAGTTGLLFNGGGTTDQADATKTSDFTAIPDNVYTTSGPQATIDEYNPGNSDNPGTKTCKVYYDNTNTKWTTPYIYYWDDMGGNTPSNGWPGVPMTTYQGQIWVYEIPAAATGVLFNGGGTGDEADGTKSEDFVVVANHVYTKDGGDQGDIADYNPGTVIPGTYPEKLYLLGTVNGYDWVSTHLSLASTHTDGVYEWKDVDINTGDGTGYGYFSFATKIGDVHDWDIVNSGDRYGSEAFNNSAENTPLTAGQEATIVHNPANVSAMGATAWRVDAARYDVTANLKTMKVKVSYVGTTGVEDIINDNEGKVEFYNFQGVRVVNPTNGVYIRVQGNTATKVFVK